MRKTSIRASGRETLRSPSGLWSPESTTDVASMYARMDTESTPPGMAGADAFVVFSA